MITHPILESIRHGFFTRQGGSSAGLYASLNCSFDSGDDPKTVEDNQARALLMLDIPDLSLVTVKEVQSSNVVVVEHPWSRSENPEADALVTARPGTCLAILTADSPPLLLADPSAKVIGAAEVGWHGALGKIAEATIAAMCRLGAERERIRVAIGPAIQQNSYEVDESILRQFLEADSDNARFFRPAARSDHHMFDLPGLVENQLSHLGLAGIGNVGLDTSGDEERFFSHRRSLLRGEIKNGSQISLIALA
jgi:YfiH family protein